MAKATALRVNLAPSIPSTPRPPTRKSHAHLLYAVTPLTSPTTSSPPMARERACSTIPKVVAFASRSFISPFTVVSGLRPTQ